MYLATVLVFFVIGGVEALLMRTQLAVPENTLLSPERYNQLLTMHGTTMIFLVIVPVWAGFANYFLPLMIGARDVAFPRLNAWSYWMFLFGGIATFLMGGITGIFLAVFPVDWQLTDTYFVVAHFHYTAFGASAFAMVAALYYWFPKMTGRKMSEGLGRISFVLFFIGFHLTFLIQHSAGLDGMPRRIYEYSATAGWTAQNVISSIGSYI